MKINVSIKRIYDIILLRLIDRRYKMKAKEVRSLLRQSIMFGQKIIVRRYDNPLREYSYSVAGSHVRRDVGEKIWNESRGEIYYSQKVIDAKEREY
jgi:hypothetical protein